MKKYLTEEEFKQVQEHLIAGDASLTISRSISRQFYMRVSNSAVKSATGHSTMTQKVMVWSVQTSALLALVVCCGLIIDSFGWWAAFAVPLTGAFWAILAGFTNEDGGWPSITIILAASLASSLFIIQMYSIPLIFFVFSLWLHRMTYILAQKFLITLVVNSYATYDMLAENIDIQDPMTSESAE